MSIEQVSHYRDWLMQHGGRDLEIQDAYRPEVLDGDWKPLVAQAKAALDGYQGRMGIHGPYDGLWMDSFDPAVRRLVAERYRKGLEFAADLGASHMVIHSPFLFFGHPLAAHSAANGLPRQIENVHATLESILPLASSLGVTLVIENICDTNPAPLRTLVGSFDSEYVRLSVDVGHAFLMHQKGGPTPDQWVLEAGSLLGHLHLQDNDGTLDRHWNPGQGGINWQAIFRALARSEARPRLILEVRPNETAAAARWLAEQGLAV
ncbi:sugar phosphate isomerase/epimerase family protein [uncultured Meiothermus sp.]|jgi:sugar phosphate isomerase/epimerase|uniref:sugar phosphate isomerase/epimerase family protein n=1 Tax=uncultured Meiothermus sp. TaxID=157471 RepID=UPI0026155B42|nr:sugar phosphate isomerase/epimerase family protein [uncultured Meiothermus sp.]